MTYIQVKNSFKRYQVGETEIIANHDVIPMLECVILT